MPPWLFFKDSYHEELETEAFKKTFDFINTDLVRFSDEINFCPQRMWFDETSSVLSWFELQMYLAFEKLSMDYQTCLYLLKVWKGSTESTCRLNERKVTVVFVCCKRQKHSDLFAGLGFSWKAAGLDARCAAPGLLRSDDFLPGQLFSNIGTVPRDARTLSQNCAESN